MASGFSTYWSSKSLFDRPSIGINAHLNSSVVNTDAFFPIDNIQSFIIQCKKSCFCTVFNLLRISRPFYIVRFIITIIIDTIKRMFRCWSISNIVKKCDKRVTPFFTNKYSTTTITMIITNICVITSANHMSPSSIFFGSMFTIFAVTMFHLLLLGYNGMGDTLLM